jgi:hypothetical protein
LQTKNLEGAEAEAWRNNLRNPGAKDAMIASKTGQLRMLEGKRELEGRGGR